MQEEWLKSMTKDDMPNEVFEDIATHSLEAAMVLLEHFGGCNLYVPSDGFRTLKNKYIVRNFDGSAQSIRKLAIETGTTEQNVRNVLKRYKDVDLADGQIQLPVFGE